MATALRCRPSRWVRRTALWAKRWRNCDGVILAISWRVSVRNSSDGAKSGKSVALAPRLCGHTSWQVSQPYTRLPIADVTHSGSSPRRSISWHDRHRRASTALLPCKAWPGHDRSQRPHPLHDSWHGSSGMISSVVTSSPRKKNDPCPGMISILLRPMNPIPACCAQ